MTVLALLTPKTFGGFRKWRSRAHVAALIGAALMLGHNFIYLPIHASSCVGQASRIEMTSPVTALAIYAGATKIRPDATTFASLGFLAERMSQWQIATTAFYRANQAEPGETIYLYKLGMLSGNKQMLVQAAATEPNNPIFNDVLRQM